MSMTSDRHALSGAARAYSKRRALRKFWRSIDRARPRLLGRTAPETLEDRVLLAADVAISEIMYMPGTMQLQDEWIELHNNGATSVDISGWQLTSGIHYTFPAATMAPGEFIVLAADPGRFSSDLPKPAGVTYHVPQGTQVFGPWDSGELANTGEQLTVTDSVGNTVDSVTYASEGDWAQRLKGRGYAPAISITHSGSTATATLIGAEYTAGDQVEIMGADQSIYNGTFTVSSANGNTFTFNLPSTPPSNATGYITVRQLTDRGHSGWSWGTLAHGGGRSIEVMNLALSNNDGQNWSDSAVAGGTPGAVNSVATANIAPEILDVTLSPMVPKSTDVVTVTTRIKDEAVAGQQVLLHWRDDGNAGFNIVAMHDDGLNGDAVALDGIWSAEIPPRANNTIVELYISASDGSQQRTWPPAALDFNNNPVQSANLLYQVDNSAYSGTQALFKLVMTASEAAELAYIGNQSFTGEGATNAAFNGTMIAIEPTGAQAFYSIEVRNRGGGSRDAAINNYRVNLNTDNRWHGQRALNFNAEYSMEEVAASAVARAAGIPTQTVVAVQVRVNGQNLASTSQYDMFGSYSLLEAENSDMVDRQFPTDRKGNYYRAVDAGHAANLQYLGESASNMATYFRLYGKKTNSDENDFSDIVGLMRALDPSITPDAVFASAFSAVADVTQWLRYLAWNSLAGNMETTFATGVGDDYALYRGVEDPRFQLVLHDLDTILGVGDTSPSLSRSIFYAADQSSTMSQRINRIMRNPAFTPIYYAQLRDLAATAFSPDRISEILGSAVGEYVPSATTDTMKQFVASRVANVLSQIPSTLSASSTLSVSSGYPRTTTSVAPAGAVTGYSDAVRTGFVRINGQPTTWDPVTGKWTAPAIGLRPGINHLVVQAFDSSSQEFARSFIDIWYDDSSTVNVSGTLPTGVTHWSALGGPYRITGSVTVPSGGILQIEPGTSVYFDAGTSLTINGQILAIGSEFQRIQFTRTPGSGSNWNQVGITNSSADNQIRYVDMSYGGSGGHIVHVNGSRVDLDNLTWTNATSGAQILTFDNSSFRLTNSILPDCSGVEPAHYSGFPSGGYALIQGNIFGRTTGFNDIFDFTGGNRPGNILYVLDNVFLGAGIGNVVGDDILDLDGTDTHIEGNVFLNVYNAGGADTNSAISGGKNGSDTSEITVVRNIFYNVDHAMLAKEGNDIYSFNNTIVKVGTGVWNFYEPGNNNSGAGVGGMSEGDIYVDVPMVNGSPVIVENPGTGPFVVSYSAVPGDSVWPGVGNTNLDPNLAHTTEPPDVSQMTPAIALQTMRDWFALRPGPGPAVGTGPNGTDMGADVPFGATIAGEPDAVTTATSATLTIGRRDLYAYKYKVNNGAWSSEIPVANYNTRNAAVPPIVLSGLAPGSYTVYVIEKNSAGYWQSESAPTASRTWTVVTSLPEQPIRINEVMADNKSAVNHEGTYPDLIELYNPNDHAVDLGGMSISDDPALPQKFIFPAGTIVDAGDYLVLYADSAAGTSGIHVGFSLKSSGEDIHLYDAPVGDQAPVEIDSVTYGIQLADMSIGRAADGSWTLTQPTFGDPNIAAPMGDPSLVSINEWLTSGVAPFSSDFIELYNPNQLPVNIGSYYLTDQSATWADRFQLAPLSFIAGSGHGVLTADGDTTAGADHTNFKLAPQQGEIGLFDPSLNKQDVVVYGTQRPGVSQGRTPDGASVYGFFAVPNPGLANPHESSTTLSVPLVNLNDVWRYNSSGTNLGTTWRDEAYVDTGWSSAQALLGNQGSASIPGFSTTINIGPSGSRYPTVYFRRHFNFDGTLSSVTDLLLTTFVDDGCIVYLNGVQVFSIGMPTNVNPITYSTYTNSGGTNGRTVGTAKAEGPFTLGPTGLAALHVGDNVLAVEVHQTNPNSSDMVWGGSLSATEQVSTTATANVRVTEINYHPGGATGTTYTPDDFEFVELMNTDTSSVSLANYQLVGGISYTFGSITLAPGERLVVAKNPAALSSRYGSGLNMVGPYTGSLSDSGEELRLISAQGVIVQDFTFSNQWYADTDGDGYTLTINDPAGDPAGWSNPADWHASNAIFGTPGMPESSTPVNAVIVNEFMAHSHATAADWIELYNTTGSDINISGWFLSDSATNLLKYRIGPDTILPAGGYAVFYEDTQFNNPADSGTLEPFSLSEAGDEIWISSGDGTILTGYRQGTDFGATASGVSMGYYTRSTGNTTYAAMATPTPDGPNSDPKVGPVVINEIHYHPASGGLEYIELYNNSPDVVEFWDPLVPENTWSFTNGISYTFPQNTTLAAGAYMLITTTDPAAFRTKYNIPSYVQIYGGTGVGALDNGGERIELSMPGDAEGGAIPWIREDTVKYDDTAPWPTSPDGDGPSLARISPTAFGDDVINWAAETLGSPGFENFDTTAPTATVVPVDPDPSAVPVDSITLSFSEPVLGVTPAALTLTRNGQPVSLAGATLDTADGHNWILGNLPEATSMAGAYELTLTGAGSGITDQRGNPLAGNASDAFDITASTYFAAAGDNAWFVEDAGGTVEIRTGSPAGAIIDSYPAGSVPPLSFLGANGNDSLTIDAALPASPSFEGGPGSNTLTLNAGSYALQGDNGDNLDLVVNNATVQVGSAHAFAGIAVGAGGQLGVAANGDNLIQTGSLTIDAGGVVDLADNDLVVGYAGSSPIDAIRQYILSGALTTSATQPVAGQEATLGQVDNAMIHQSTWSGVPINDGSNFDQVIVKYTYAGDTNLDGTVSAADYANVIANQGQSGQWFDGDVNHDGSITADDLALVTLNLGAGSGGASGPLLLTAPTVATASAAATATTPTTTASAPVEATTPVATRSTVRTAAKATAKPTTDPLAAARATAREMLVSQSQLHHAAPRKLNAVLQQKADRRWW